MAVKSNIRITILALLLALFSSNIVVAGNQLSAQQLQPGQTPEGLSQLEWDSIQQQVRAIEYRAFAQGDGGYASANRANGWRIEYGKDGRTTLTPYRSNEDAYFIGLQLKSLGYANQLAYKKPQKINADKTRLVYQWDENVQEVWTNSSNRLEQWFEIQHRPQGAEQGQKLTIQMALTTDLEVAQNGNSLSFANKISYSKLKVWDKNGTEIPATMQLQNKLLSLVVDDSLASYPLTVDPSFQQQAYLKASNTDAGDRFGQAVAISGDTLVVGADQEKSIATGVNGDETNNSRSTAGAAYVFVRSAGVWSQQAYLKASNTGAGDRFGGAVAISGNTLVIGATEESSNATGIDGDQANNTANDAGAVYVFNRTGTVWSQQAYLKASNSEAGDRFGRSVAISGDTLVVGSSDGSNATGVNGDETDNSAIGAGAAYVFTRTAGVWSQQAYLKASNTDAIDGFGSSVAILGDTLVIGASGEDSNAIGIDGDQTDNAASNAGAVYVFNRTGTVWSQLAYLKSSNSEAGDVFGFSVALSADTLVVGAMGEASNATGVNGDQTDNSLSAAGASYVFTRTAGAWSQQAYLKSSNPGQGDFFGNSVALDGDTLLVGAQNEDSNATGVDGDQTDNSTLDAGAAYVFTRSGTAWSQQAYLKASNTGVNNARFGFRVGLSGNTLVTGAPNEASNATGVDGDDANNLASGSGAVYVFNPSTLGPADQIISNFIATPAAGIVNGSATLSATASSGLAVSFGSNTPAVCTVSGTTVSYLTAGTCTVTADQAGDASFNPAPQLTLDIAVSLAVADQVITGFSATPPSGLVAGSSTLSATASSGLAVSFGSSTPAVCTVSGATVSYLTAGTCTVTADQAGDVSFNPAPQVTLDIAVSLADQDITDFAATPPGGLVAGSSTLSATASSGLAVSFGSSTPAVCTVSGAIVSYLTAGTCTVTADQAGDVSFNPAPQITLNISVTAPVVILPVQPIPTLSLWSLIVMFLIIMGLGGVVIRRRTQA